MIGLKTRIRRVQFEWLLSAAKVLCRPAAPIWLQHNKFCISARH